MPWLALIKRPKILTIIALVVGGGFYVMWLRTELAELRTDIVELQGEINRKESQIGTLTASVKRQNDAVDEWKAKAQARAEAAHRAIREAHEAKEKADEAVGRLQAQEVMTCQEGIDLIDQELGL